jgi:putative tryptophan/tyrosine transport system substrate-binding protein
MLGLTLTIIQRIALFVAIVSAATAGTAMGDGISGITVLVSHDSAQSEEVIRGIRDYLASRGVSAELTVQSLGGDATRSGAVLEGIKRERRRPLVTLGSVATNAALKETQSSPIVAGLVLDAEDFRSRGNVTGVFLEFPLEVQFEWMKRMLPAARSLGVLYHSERNGRRIQEAVRIASSLGVQIYAQRVDTPSDIPNALESLARKVDALWGIPDELVLNPQTGKQFLLFSYRNSIPFIGLSETWVKAGALYALGWDYHDIGAQCGEQLIKILRGGEPSSMLPEPPRKVRYYINTKTAYHMKLDLQDSLIKGAQQLVE